MPMYAFFPESSTRTTKYREESSTASTEGRLGSYSVFANTTISLDERQTIRVKKSAYILLQTPSQYCPVLHYGRTCSRIFKKDSNTRRFLKDSHTALP